jgi:hypothetical protein
MSIGLALADAANNCTRQGATATLTLRSGVQIAGRLERSVADLGTAHIKKPDGGWAAVREDEIAAVETTP